MIETDITASNLVRDLMCGRRLVVVSNREPFQIYRERDSLRLERTKGGLVSALDPILQNHEGLWICWNDITQEGECSLEDLCHLAELNNLALPYNVHTVKLTEEEIEHYYFGFANQQIWPLFHYFPSRFAFNELDWFHYQEVNYKFAQAIVENTKESDLVWIQDYHLMRVPHYVRQVRPNASLGFFCHIPFPHQEMFKMLPTRKEILEGILGSDIIGFHTPEYVSYFIDSVETLLPGKVEIIDENTIICDSRTIRVEHFPISIDYEIIDNLAQSPAVNDLVTQLKNMFQPAELIGLGVDRLDYTKGILDRLECIALFFERYPEYRKRLVFVQIAVPSRTKVQQYQFMKQEIDEAVGRINGRYSEDGWVPIHYLYRGFPLEELVAYYKVADFALINPLRDGMNLVAKEYCAAQTDSEGVLILSEMTGAAVQLRESLLVNPYDHPAVVEAIHSALNISREEKQVRMRALRRKIERDNIEKWLNDFITGFNDAVIQRTIQPE